MSVLFYMLAGWASVVLATSVYAAFTDPLYRPDPIASALNLIAIILALGIATVAA